MKWKFTSITIIMLLFQISLLNGQNTIITLKGDVFKTSAYKIVEENDYKELKYKNDRGKYKYLDYESIFSIETEEKKSIVYKPRNQADLSVIQMKNMVNGRIAGKKGGFPWGAFFISYAATSCTGFLDQGDIFAAPLVPLGTTIGIGLYGWFSEPKVDNSNEFYKTGYTEQKTFRHIKASLLGGGAGLITATGIHTVRNYDF